MVKVAAPQHILLTAAGAAIRIEGGNITLSAPGKVEFRASQKELGGPRSASADAPQFPRPFALSLDPETPPSAQLLDHGDFPASWLPSGVATTTVWTQGGRLLGRSQGGSLAVITLTPEPQPIVYRQETRAAPWSLEEYIDIADEPAAPADEPEAPADA
ncbi:hypothetical protein CKO43_24895 [Rubrivivax gelatinosus]|uniref:DUF2345 domain-containing protein n=3 Tax=Rubrivivax gelatinosus TaxID=28068 RepID=A0ABS1E3F0_RUBGE|nr:hypothetical protein [Rubrivivax gelatinosus]